MQYLGSCEMVRLLRNLSTSSMRLELVILDRLIFKLVIHSVNHIADSLAMQGVDRDDLLIDIWCFVVLFYFFSFHERSVV